MIHQEVMQFISRFASARECFLYGCCYWFAFILKTRFSTHSKCELMYHVIDNHFATMIDGELYDASGHISVVGFVPWREIEQMDALLFSRVIHDTILMEDENV